MSESLLVAAFYKFSRIPDPEQVQSRLETVAREAGIRGTILVAGEGLNGTIAGPEGGVRDVLDHIRQLPGFADIEHKEAIAPEQPFHRLKVRLKKEIVTLGVEGIDPPSQAGTYVDPETWNRLIEDPDVLVIDTRNDYEVKVGTFQRAVNPHTSSFREFPDWVDSELDPSENRRVAMFCTGGIRCEKATALLRNRGFEEVYHLRGGILKYLEDVRPENSKWNGECFVFDERVSVDHDLQPGEYELCHACRMPVSPEDREHPHFEDGVSCPACYESRTEQDRERFRERKRQMELAEARGEAHIGDDARRILRQRRGNTNQPGD